MPVDREQTPGAKKGRRNRSSSNRQLANLIATLASILAVLQGLLAVMKAMVPLLAALLPILEALLPIMENTHYYIRSAHGQVTRLYRWVTHRQDTESESDSESDSDGMDISDSPPPSPAPSEGVPGTIKVPWPTIRCGTTKTGSVDEPYSPPGGLSYYPCNHVDAPPPSPYLPDNAVTQATSPHPSPAYNQAVSPPQSRTRAAGTHTQEAAPTCPNCGAAGSQPCCWTPTDMAQFADYNVQAASPPRSPSLPSRRSLLGSPTAPSHDGNISDAGSDAHSPAVGIKEEDGVQHFRL